MVVEIPIEEDHFNHSNNHNHNINTYYNHTSSTSTQTNQFSPSTSIATTQTSFSLKPEAHSIGVSTNPISMTETGTNPDSHNLETIMAATASTLPIPTLDSSKHPNNTNISNNNSNSSKTSHQFDNEDELGNMGIFQNPFSKFGNASTTAENQFMNTIESSDPDYLKLILTARVYDIAIETPLQIAQNLSNRLNNTILLKREDLQPVFSFKSRGAFNRMQQLSTTEKEKGVIACSAGNHAQGVAMAAKKMGIKATIVMPTMTPPIKWKNVERLGANIVLFGNDFDEAKKECYRLSKVKWELFLIIDSFIFYLFDLNHLFFFHWFILFLILVSFSFSYFFY